MMEIKDNKLYIYDIPNSEFNVRNSLIDKKLKSSVGEFYITKEYKKEINNESFYYKSY